MMSFLEAISQPWKRAGDTVSRGGILRPYHAPVDDLVPHGGTLSAAEYDPVEDAVTAAIPEVWTMAINTRSGLVQG